jgi:hypothetical protein
MIMPLSTSSRSAVLRPDDRTVGKMGDSRPARRAFWLIGVATFVILVVLTPQAPAVAPPSTIQPPGPSPSQQMTQLLRTCAKAPVHDAATASLATNSAATASVAPISDTVTSLPPSDGPPTSGAYGEARRGVPTRPIIGLALGVIIIVGTIVLVRRNKSQGRRN